MKRYNSKKFYKHCLIGLATVNLSTFNMSCQMYGAEFNDVQLEQIAEACYGKNLEGEKSEPCIGCASKDYYLYSAFIRIYFNDLNESLDVFDNPSLNLTPQDLSKKYIEIMLTNSFNNYVTFCTRESYFGEWSQDQKVEFEKLILSELGYLRLYDQMNFEGYRKNNSLQLVIHGNNCDDFTNGARENTNWPNSELSFEDIKFVSETIDSLFPYGMTQRTLYELEFKE